jgi:hypothetical protein
MGIRVKHLEEADLEAVMQLDRAYASLHGLEELASAASVRFFGRTEHSFTAEADGPDGAATVGFLLAQAVWSGVRPQVLVARVAAPGQPPAAAALLKAVVKSAYDSGVYDLVARVPRGDQGLVQQLETEEFFLDPQLAYVRILGSRGVGAAERAAAGHG